MAIELPRTSDERTATRALLARPGHARVTARERMFFTERLALLLATGNSLHASLEILAQQAGHSPIARVASAVRESIAGGMPFSQALGLHPAVFSPTYVNLVAASEAGGFMAQALEQLTGLEEKAAELRSTVLSAFSYPAFLCVFSLAVVVFVLTAVFPKFEVMFHTIRDDLPASTLILMAVSNTLREHWLAVGVALGGTGAVLAAWFARPAGAAVLDGARLRLPGVRTIYIQLYLAQSMRVMGLSLRHGVSVPDALRASREVVSNRRFRDLIDTVARDVQEGRGMSGAFERSAMVPTLTKQMLATGEESGNLAVVMERLADFYERELARALRAFSKLVEPVMLLIMGVVVGLLVSSLILPIFKLSRAVG